MMNGTSKKQELTSRQREVLNLLCKGLTNAEICSALKISPNTVKIHLSNIYKILDVTNRTEAVAAGMDLQEPQKERNEVPLAIVYSEGFKDIPLAHDLALSIVESLRSFDVFQIKFCTADAVPPDTCYQVSLTTPQDDIQGLFISLHLGPNVSLLWSCVQKIENSDQIKLLSDQIAVQLYRNIILSATEEYAKNPEISPLWWYASCHTIVKMENRNQEDFETSEAVQQTLLKNENHKDFVVGALSAIYYAAMTEHWISAEVCAVKLGKVACQSMRDNPSSLYSQFAMALYNMFLGNVSEAISYFENILKTESSIGIVCRRLLAQMYAIVGRTDDAWKQLDEYDHRIPSSMHQPFQYVANAYIAFIKRDYDECEKISNQVLMFHPETPFARLFMIACCYRKGDLFGHEMNIQQLFEHHPNFSLKDLSPFLDTFPPTEKNHILDCLSAFLDIFRQN